MTIQYLQNTLEAIWFYSFLISTALSGNPLIWNNTCYVPSDQPTNHADAITACIQRNSTLLMVHTLEENDAILPLTQSTSFWVGGYGNAKSGWFTWLDNGTILTSLWMVNKPDSHGDCVRYRSQKRGLANTSCHTKFKFICKVLENYCDKEPGCCVDQASTVLTASAFTAKTDNMEWSSSMTSEMDKPSSYTEISASHLKPYSGVPTTTKTNTIMSTPLLEVTRTVVLTTQRISDVEQLSSSEQISSVELVTTTRLLPYTHSLKATQIFSVESLQSSVSEQTPCTNLVQETISLNTTTVSDNCLCRCFRNDTTPEQIVKEYKEILKSISRPKKKTSLAIRKLTSAADPRTSAAAMGYLGVIILIVPVVLIVICDLQRCFMKPIVPKSRRSPSCVSVKIETTHFVPDISSI